MPRGKRGPALRLSPVTAMYGTPPAPSHSGRTTDSSDSVFGLDFAAPHVHPPSMNEPITFPLTRERAHLFAEDWIRAWNAHDIDRILLHYEDDVVLTSPVLARLIDHSHGMLSGKPALADYFRRGLEAFPDLQFVLEDVFLGIDTLVLYYRNQRGAKVAEVMQLAANGRVRRIWANYSA